MKKFTASMLGAALLLNSFAFTSHADNEAKREIGETKIRLQLSDSVSICSCSPWFFAGTCVALISYHVVNSMLKVTSDTAAAPNRFTVTNRLRFFPRHSVSASWRGHPLSHSSFILWKSARCRSSLPLPAVFFLSRSWDGTTHHIVLISN